MNSLQQFDFRGRGVRITDSNGEPWFVAKDVCDVLGYENSRDAISTHCKNQNTVAIRDGKAGNPNTTIIPESDLYRLVIRSHMPNAEAFTDWIVGEVLPSIRRTGGYGYSQTQSKAERLYDELREELISKGEHERLKLLEPLAEAGELSEKSGLPKNKLIPAHWRSDRRSSDPNARAVAYAAQMNFLGILDATMNGALETRCGEVQL